MKSMIRLVAVVVVMALMAGSARAETWQDFRRSIANLRAGIATVDTARVTSATLTRAAIEESVRTVHAVTITSPTKTVNVDGKHTILLTTDVSQTGVTLTGGEEGQEVRIIGTSDSATTRWDDNGSTLALGGNITLGVDDTLDLQATATGESGALRWARTGNLNN